MSQFPFISRALNGHRKYAFSDTDFFRRLVADRAVMATLPNFPSALDYISMAYTSAQRAKTPETTLDALIHVAALCERAAVDITIPNSRLAQKRKSNRVHRVNPVQKGKSK
jgi:hypothetical protein